MRSIISGGSLKHVSQNAVTDAVLGAFDGWANR
jgi:hypothetical protein